MASGGNDKGEEVQWAWKTFRIPMHSSWKKKKY